MTLFLLLDEEQTEILGFGLASALANQRRAMAVIMRERIQLAADGEPNPAEWKQTRFNALAVNASRLIKLIEKVDGTPDTADSPGRE